MYYNSTNLIGEAALIKAVRQSCSQVQASETLDREQILQAIALACTDLDTADPLIYQHHVPFDPSAPSTEIVFKPAGPRVLAVYAGDIDQDNVCDFEWVDAETAAITPPTHNPRPAEIISLVKWPRQTKWTQYDPGPWPGVRVRTTHNLITSSVTEYVLTCPTLTMPEAWTDGLALEFGPDTILVMNQTDTSQNGVYSSAYDEPSDSYVLTRVGNPALATDWPQWKRVTVAAGNLYAGKTYWNASPSTVQILQHTPVIFAEAMPACNISTSEAAAYIIPRAAAYIIQSLAAAELDKSRALRLSEWSAAILARPLPVTSQAISHRIKTATRYSNT